MEGLIKNPLKQASIGQAIVTAARPRSTLSPILFGTAVEMDHLFGSKWLLGQLSSLGFSKTIDEVTRYKQSVVCNDDQNYFIKCTMQGCFGQWSADNVDHNVRTLDGKGTLHAMGIVLSTAGASVTAASSNLPYIPRQMLMKQSDVVQNKGIAVVMYCAPECYGLSKLSFQSVEQICKQSQCTMSPDVQLDLLWHVSKFTSNIALESRPGWSGYMTDVSKGDYPGQSIVHMLPIIDLDPTDMSCIYSTLLFVIKQAKELNIPTPILTFDQPLWLKAMEIVKALNLKVILILGGFRTMMSYVGCIGKLMSQSGLSTALETVYGKVAVTHILTGKAIAKALRGFFMLESVLISRLLSQFFPEISKDFSENKIDIMSDMDDDSSSYGTESDYDINEDNDDGVTSDDPVRNENNVKQLSDIEFKNIESLCDVIQKDYQ